MTENDPTGKKAGVKLKDLLKNDPGLPSEVAEEFESKSKPLSKYFYKVQNHVELFKIGQSFYTDFKKRKIKSFAISSTGYQASQQRTILGLASFFDHQEDDIRIAIISDNLFNGVFDEVIGVSNVGEITFENGYTVKNVHSFYNHFEFIDLKELLPNALKEMTYSQEMLIKKIVNFYDIVFWDVPHLMKLRENSEHYFQIIMMYESLSIITVRNAARSKDVDEIYKFFKGYGINLKGLILDSEEVQKPESEKKPAKKDGFFKRVLK